MSHLLVLLIDLKIRQLFSVASLEFFRPSALIFGKAPAENYQQLPLN